MTPEEAERTGRALVGLIDALGENGRVTDIGRTPNGFWYVSTVSEVSSQPLWQPLYLESGPRLSLADALDDLAAKIRERESRRRVG